MEDRILPGQSVQRTCNGGEVFYISLVVTGKTEEGADFGSRFGRWNFPNGYQERRVGQEAFFRDPVSQVADLFRVKCALFGPQLEVGVPESLKDLPEPSDVFLPGGGKDDNIVQVKQARLQVETREDAIHEAREGGGSVAKTKLDLIKFVQLPTAGTKGGLFFISLLDWNLPVATLQINRRKPPSSVKSVEEVVYPGQRVCVLDGSRLKLSKIDTKTQATVLFFLPSPPAKPTDCWRGG